jgi:hypothetical protein
MIYWVIVSNVEGSLVRPYGSSVAAEEYVSSVKD